MKVDMIYLTVSTDVSTQYFSNKAADRSQRMKGYGIP
jgi:hypothetical protein